MKDVVDDIQAWCILPHTMVMYTCYSQREFQQALQNKDDPSYPVGITTLLETWSGENGNMASVLPETRAAEQMAHLRAFCTGKPYVCEYSAKMPTRFRRPHKTANQVWMRGLLQT